MARKVAIVKHNLCPLPTHPSFKVDASNEAFKQPGEKKKEKKKSTASLLEGEGENTPSYQ